MVNYPYTIKAGALKKFLEKIPIMGVPLQVTQKYLNTLGLKSSNDRKLIPVLKFIKFLDDSAGPTEYYKAYRDTSKSSKILGRAIKKAYAEVFNVYPNAEKQDIASLRNFFSSYTNSGEKVIKSTVETFKALCSLADLNDDSLESTEPLKIDEEEKDKNSNETSAHRINFSLSKGRNAQISVPEDITEKEIDKLKSLLDVLK